MEAVGGEGRETYPLESEWSWYIHFETGGGDYKDSSLKIGTFSTLYDYCSYVNHVPDPCLSFSPTFCPSVGGKRVTAYSVFRSDITPEWEHPSNLTGSEWVIRDCPTAKEAGAAFKLLCDSAVGETLPDGVNGVRFVTKRGRRLFLKVEVWMEEGADVSAVADSIRCLLPGANLSHQAHSSKMEGVHARKKK